MEIAIFQDKSIGILENDINHFLDKHGNNIDIKQMVQSTSGEYLIITILFSLKETF